MTPEEFIQDIVDHYNDWNRSDLQGYVMANFPDTTDKVLNEIDIRLAKLGVGI